MDVNIETGIEEIQVLPCRDYGNKDEIFIQLKHGVTMCVSTRQGIISHLSIVQSGAKSKE